MTDTETEQDTVAELSLDDLPQPEEEGTVEPSALSVDGDNPNEQSEEMFQKLCENMKKRGWLDGPILADMDGVIADGEHRWRAAQEIGLGEVPVEFHDISDAERRLWRQELNKISGEHDRQKDAAEFDRLLSEGYSSPVEELTDATGEDLEGLLDDLAEDDPIEVPEEDTTFEGATPDTSPTGSSSSTASPTGEPSDPRDQSGDDEMPDDPETDTEGRTSDGAVASGTAEPPTANDSETTGSANDPHEEWEKNGGVEDENEDLEAEHKITVHIRNDEDLKEFEELMGQEVPEYPRSIWYPEAEELDASDKVAVNQNASED